MDSGRRIRRRDHRPRTLTPRVRPAARRFFWSAVAERSEPKRTQRRHRFGMARSAAVEFAGAAALRKRRGADASRRTPKQTAAARRLLHRAHAQETHAGSFGVRWQSAVSLSERSGDTALGWRGVPRWNLRTRLRCESGVALTLPAALQNKPPRRAGYFTARTRRKRFPLAGWLSRYVTCSTPLPRSVAVPTGRSTGVHVAKSPVASTV